MKIFLKKTSDFQAHLGHKMQNFVFNLLYFSGNIYWTWHLLTLKELVSLQFAFVKLNVSKWEKIRRLGHKELKGTDSSSDLGDSEIFSSPLVAKYLHNPHIDFSTPEINK